MIPRPAHSGQAPAELKLKSPGWTRLTFAYTLRTVSMTPMYDAGVDRDEAVIALWSMTIASRWTAVKTSETSVDLPDPATPVTAVSTPVGNCTSTPFRLCNEAP